MSKAYGTSINRDSANEATMAIATPASPPNEFESQLAWQAA